METVPQTWFPRDPDPVPQRPRPGSPDPHGPRVPGLVDNPRDTETSHRE
ncbi:hypothetical protein EYF80_066272 [Liparis tanakae]|uniref:Uncharacterized protein n=1 Tax=Liparis tanakae TaxID=230148 RepID=A0A4Z2E4E3_9TELE|nr:hypothetical protein EYF80_066272 [Liparis tanakae]